MEGDGGAGAAGQSLAAYELRKAVHDLSARGLKLAAKWAAEQLVGLPASVSEGSSADISFYPTDFGKTPSYKLLFAKSLLDVGEYQRSAAVFGPTDGGVSGLEPTEQFIRHFALYLAGEKQKEEETRRLSAPLERCSITNPNLLMLHEELSVLYEHKKLDGFGLYIFGVVLKEMRLLSPTDGPVNALAVLHASARAYPWNWSAWLDLVEVVQQLDTVPEELEEPLPQCPYMHNFFMLHLCQSLSNSGEALDLIETLRETFPNSQFLAAQEGRAHFNDRNFKEAQKVFRAVLEKDPYRLDDLYLYGHVLFVDLAKAELSHLAHLAVKTDQNRAETCCILGNYCSVKGEHTRAILYFSRALRLNKKFHEGWTLLGHEYLELKKTGAAIEHYRRGVDANPKDFRAWNGLGHTYEFMQMHLFALYYFRKAAALRPYDARLLNSLAASYEKLGYDSDAVRVYSRALAVHDAEGIALAKLAKLHIKMKDPQKARDCYVKLIEVRGLDQMETDLRVEALLYLAHAYKDTKNPHDLPKATEYATKLLDYNGPEKEEAYAILKQIREYEKINDSAMSMDDDDDDSSGLNQSDSTAAGGSFALSP